MSYIAKMISWLAGLGKRIGARSQNSGARSKNKNTISYNLSSKENSNV